MKRFTASTYVMTPWSLPVRAFSVMQFISKLEGAPIGRDRGRCRRRKHLAILMGTVVDHGGNRMARKRQGKHDLILAVWLRRPDEA
jgi:hypothetical protein